MDPQLLIATTAITACTSGIIGAIVAAIVSAVRTKGHEQVGGAKAMQSGMRALLWRELKEIRAQAVEQDGLTIEDRRHLESVYAPYHALGGNGTGTRLYEEAMSKQVLE